MEYRPLGGSGLLVSVYSFGAMTFGGGGIFDNVGTTQVAEAKRQIGMCLDVGVNLFDTADVYSAGRSEEILAQALGKQRPQVLIATKVFGTMGDGPNDLGLSRHHITTACEASLKRLGTDYIDLYQVHNFDGTTPLDETLRALDDLVSAGKVRYIGSSNYTGWQLMKAASISEHQNLSAFVSQQIQYSLLHREAEFELLPAGLDQGVGALLWSPLAQGYLTGKFRSGPQKSARLVANAALDQMDDALARRVLDALEGVATHYKDVSIAQCALNYLRRKAGVSSIIVGARTDEQLADNLAAASWSMSDEDVALLDEASAVALPYPYSHQATYGRGRNRKQALLPIPESQA